MPKETPIISDSKVKYRGVFDLGLVYNKLRFWIMETGYSEPHEIKYVEKIKPGGKDIEIIWESERSEEDGFFKFTIGVKFYATRLNDVEVDKEGRKLKLQKGDLWLYFDAKFIVNANKKWEENGLMYKLYEKFIIKDKLDHYKIELYTEANKIMAEVKDFLNLYNL